MMQSAEGHGQLSRDLFVPEKGKVREVTPQQAWQALQQNSTTLLVDVRTPEELPHYGKPDLGSHAGQYHFIPWRLMPDFSVNSQFLDTLSKAADSDAIVIFFCKMGGRSEEAAMTASKNGYVRCYNLTGGMEGEQGWKASGLAWGNA